jgi:hypothetical protein
LQNESAEELMRKIEKEEEKVQSQDPYKLCFHLCIVNLVIGTLYCAKQNFEFGISRIIKSLEPYAKKIETDTWFYAKRCFLAFIENVSKHMLVCKVSCDPVLSWEEVEGPLLSEHISLLRLPIFETSSLFRLASRLKIHLSDLWIDQSESATFSRPRRFIQ